MIFDVLSANEFIYKDTYLKHGKNEIVINSAQGGLAAFQVGCKPEGEFSVAWENTANKPLECQIFNLLAVDVYRNTNVGYLGTNYLTDENEFTSFSARKAPFSVFEVLEPIEDTEFSKNGITALYIRFDTSSLKKGTYTGVIRLFDNTSSNEIFVTLNIYDTKIPQKETLRITNWFYPEYITSHFGVKAWSSEFWDYLEKYGKMLRSGRQTDFLVHSNFFADYQLFDGEYQFDFSKAKRLIEMFLSLGFTHIEGPIMTHRLNWHYSEFYVKIKGQNVNALSSEGIAFLRAFYTQWYKFLKANGWEKIIYQHIGDEPGEHCLNEYSALSKLVKECMPNIPIFEALANASFKDAVDIMVPKSVDFLRERTKFEQIKEKREMWYYTCCEPGGEYLNRLLDQELIRSRLLHWANFIYGFEGFLHWGTNYYCYEDVFAGALEKAGNNPLPAGDTHIIYPKDRKVLSSLRLEMMRAGAEDYELLRLAEAKNPKLAKEIAAKIIRAFDDYTKNPNVFEHVYKELLENLE